jgi:hypothetical protein
MDGAEVDVEVEVEVVDGLPVLADVRPIEPVRQAPVAAVVQTAAVAATGFVAGAATAAVLGRHLGRRLGRSRNPALAAPSRQRGGELLEVVATRSFLVDVHVLGRREP